MGVIMLLRYSIPHKLYRETLLDNKERKFNKGDNRFNHKVRCSICGKELVSKYNGRFIVTNDFYISRFMGKELKICANTKSCNHYYRLHNSNEYINIYTSKLIKWKER